MTGFYKALTKYFNFKTRSARSEFWSFVFVNFILSVGIAGAFLFTSGVIFNGFEFDFDSANNASKVLAISFFAHIAVMIIPTVSLAVRRVHDINKKGAWALISLIPLIGSVIYLKFALTRGDSGENLYGEDPSKGKLKIKENKEAKQLRKKVKKAGKHAKKVAKLIV
jgi:uncharacterized membrane protein YhaH (DUF805 family)